MNTATRCHTCPKVIYQNKTEPRAWAFGYCSQCFKKHEDEHAKREVTPRTQTQLFDVGSFVMDYRKSRS